MAKKKHFKQKESEDIRIRVEGSTVVTKQGYKVRLNKYFRANNCEVQFIDVPYEYKTNVEIRSFKNGAVKYPFHPTKFKVGFIGVGEFETNKNIEAYNYWDGIMRRCYSERIHTLRESYKDCTVVPEWHNFQNFAKWFTQNFKPGYMKGWHLDKDILFKNNKVYGPETCCFVPTDINNLFTTSKKSRGKYPIGVSYKKRIKKYVAQYQSKGEVNHIGVYNSPEEAFENYKNVKESHLKGIAEEWRGKISDEVYRAILNYKVEITD